MKILFSYSLVAFVALSGCKQNSGSKSAAPKKSADSTSVFPGKSSTSKNLYALSDGICTLYTFPTAVPEDSEAGLKFGSSCPESTKINGKTVNRLEGCPSFKTEDGTKVQFYFYSKRKSSDGKTLEVFDVSQLSSTCKSYQNTVLSSNNSSGGGSDTTSEGGSVTPSEGDSDLPISADKSDTSSEKTSTITLDDGACILRTYKGSFVPDPISSEKIGSVCPGSLDVGTQKAKPLNSCPSFKFEDSEIIVTIYDKVSVGASVMTVSAAQFKDRCEEVKTNFTAPF